MTLLPCVAIFLVPVALLFPQKRPHPTVRLVVADKSTCYFDIPNYRLRVILPVPDTARYDAMLYADSSGKTQIALSAEFGEVGFSSVFVTTRRATEEISRKTQELIRAGGSVDQIPETGEDYDRSARRFAQRDSTWPYKEYISHSGRVFAHWRGYTEEGGVYFDRAVTYIDSVRLELALYIDESRRTKAIMDSLALLIGTSTSQPSRDGGRIKASKLTREEDRRRREDPLNNPVGFALKTVTAELRPTFLQVYDRLRVVRH